MRFSVPAILAFFLATGVFAQPNSPDGLTYKSGYSAMMRLGRDLYSALKPEHREMLSSQPVSLDLDVTPFVRLLYFNYPDEPKPMRGVWVSAGFIDLVNNLAHAKAIDRIERGYFKRYIAILEQETGEKSLRPLPNDTNPSYWTEDVLNEQLSNFNSIVGIVLGVKMAHHYLGQFDKHRAELLDERGDARPINNLLTSKEWDEALNKGVRNAMDAACMIEGVVPFFEAFDRMKKRPAWASYIIPDNMKFSKVRKDMERIQKRYLNGQD